jgi:hypothetical protein
VTTLGVAYDLYRVYTGKSHTLSGVDEYGDGGAYDVVPLGDGDFGDGDFGDLEGLAMSGLAMSGADEFAGPEDMGLVADYADAEMGDAEMCGADFGEMEGNALLAGADTWRATFGAPTILRTRTRRRHSRHAGRPGHQWGWLFKLVGPKRAKKIVAMEPGPRIELIAKLRAQAVSMVDGGGEMHGLAMSGLAMSGTEMGGLAMSGAPTYGDIFAGSAY